jgi:hypothetical protein
LRKYIFILLFIFLSLLLVFIILGRSPERELVTLSYLNNPVKVEDLGQQIDFYNLETDTISSEVMSQRYKQDRYVFLTERLNNNKITRFLFDTKDETINKTQHYNNTRFNVVKKKDGIIEIYDLLDNNIIYSFKDKYYMIELSSTERYLVATANKKSLLIDLDKKSELSNPVSGKTFYNWSPNDKKAIITKYADYGGGMETEYMWDLETNTINEFKSQTDGMVNWGFNGEFVYSKSRLKEGYNFSIYDINTKQWKNVYSTDLILDETSSGNIRWISPDEFLYVGSKSGKSLFANWAVEHDYYAVKVNLKKQSDKRIKLKAFSARYSVWSFDNNYIYYVDRPSEDAKAFYKLKVNFSK